MALLARFLYEIFPLNWFIWSYQSNKNIRAYRLYWQNFQSYCSDKISQLIVHTNVRDYCSEKCMILLFRQNVPDYLHDLINQTKRLSLFVQNSAWPYYCNLIRPIFHLILFFCNVTVCSISTITVTSGSFGLINQVNMTIESCLAR